MEQVLARLVERVLADDPGLGGCLLLLGLVGLVAIGRAVIKAKRFRLVIEYVAGEK